MDGQGINPLVAALGVKLFGAPAGNLGAGPPRGLRLKICIVEQPSRFARATASSSPPAIETCTPKRMRGNILS